MSVVRREARRRWAVMAVAITAVLLLPTAVAAWPGSKPQTAPARLRDLVLASVGQPYQGYADTLGAVGLPDLPVLGGVAGLLSASTTMRAWYASPLAWRVAELASTGETDTYRTADGTYVWNFERNLLAETMGEASVRLPRAADLLPPDLARRMLAGADPGRLVALPSQQVAGVSAAGLRLTPSDPDTTVGRVDVWADPKTGLPLRVEVAGRDGAAVLTSRFLELTQRSPSADLLVPSRPDSAGYTATSGQDVAKAINGVAAATLPATLSGHPRRTTPAGTTVVTGLGVYGAGLATFAVVALPGRTGTDTLQAIHDGGGAPVKVGNGEAYEIHTSLLNALIVRSPRRRTYLLVGSVSAEVLRQAGTELLALRGRP